MGPAAAADHLRHWVYKLKPPEVLATRLGSLKRQAGAEHLQLTFTVSMLRQQRHPECLVVLCDLKSNHIWEPILPANLSGPVNQSGAVDDPGNWTRRAQAVAFIRRCLQELASFPTMATINHPTPGEWLIQIAKSPASLLGGSAASTAQCGQLVFRFMRHGAR